MLRRNIRQELRDEVAIGAIIGIPVLFLLLFVYVFGGALKGSVQSASTLAYIDYVLPGLIVMTAAAGLIGISTQASVDMTAGLLAFITTGLACLGLAFGLAAKTVASASNGPFPLVVLPLVGSGSCRPLPGRPGCATSPSTSRSAR
jgi:ABC-2 type transport system permease protein